MYIDEFIFPDDILEQSFLNPAPLSPGEMAAGVYRDFRATSYRGSLYPFRILSSKGMSRVSFSDITIFCGSNGCGKTTALNVIAEKLHIKRDNMFNSGRFFQDYLNLCDYSSASDPDTSARRFYGAPDAGIKIPAESRVIVSDDVFAHSMKQRAYNMQILKERDDAENSYREIVSGDPRLRSLDDYERYKERQEALKSKSRFMKRHVEEELPEHSNGESAMIYFIDRMEHPGLYLLDEPENSLSLENQINLADYISASSRIGGYQFIIASHSPIFLSMPGARIYDMDEYPVRVKKWTEIESVRTLYNFFKTHERELE